MFTQVGPLEIVVVLVLALLIFGPKRLPGMGRSIGTNLREFKDAIGGRSDDGPAVESVVDGERAIEPSATQAPRA